ncbi:hypothetical protein ACHAWT_008799 [Skeletonema menzelii]
MSRISSTMNDATPSTRAPASRKKSMTSAHTRFDTCLDFMSMRIPKGAEHCKIGFNMEIDSFIDISGQNAARNDVGLSCLRIDLVLLCRFFELCVLLRGEESSVAADMSSSLMLEFLVMTIFSGGEPDRQGVPPELADFDFGLLVISIFRASSSLESTKSFSHPKSKSSLVSILASSVPLSLISSSSPSL